MKDLLLSKGYTLDTIVAWEAVNIPTSDPLRDVLRRLERMKIGHECRCNRCICCAELITQTRWLKETTT